jgi:hypothetical protein
MRRISFLTGSTLFRIVSPWLAYAGGKDYDIYLFYKIHQSLVVEVAWFTCLLGVIANKIRLLVTFRVDHLHKYAGVVPCGAESVAVRHENTGRIELANVEYFH